MAAKIVIGIAIDLGGDAGGVEQGQDQDDREQAKCVSCFHVILPIVFVSTG